MTERICEGGDGEEKKKEKKIVHTWNILFTIYIICAVLFSFCVCVLVTITTERVSPDRCVVCLFGCQVTANGDGMQQIDTPKNGFSCMWKTQSHLIISTTPVPAMIEANKLNSSRSYEEIHFDFNRKNVFVSLPAIFSSNRLNVVGKKPLSLAQSVCGCSVSRSLSSATDR